MIRYPKTILFAALTLIVVGCRAPVGPEAAKKGPVGIEAVKKDPTLLPKEWIKGKTTPDQAVSQFKRLPASKRAEWDLFIKQLDPMDELYAWLFIDKIAHKHHSGYFILRNNKPVSFVHLESWTSFIE